MGATFGVHCVYDASAISQVERRARLAELLLDRRWPWPLPLLRVRPVPGADAPAVVKKRLSNHARDDVRAALESASSLRIGLAASTSERDDNAWVYVDTGREPHPDGRYPYDLRAMCRTPDDRPEAITTWVELIHEIVGTLEVAHGTIVAANHEGILRSEVWAQHESHEGREVHPEPALISSLAVKRHGIGDRWVRPPRWGTYLNAEHVRAIGGRERLVTVVQPAVIREVGALLYVQLSERPEDALGADSVTRQRAFHELMAAIIVPPT